MKANQLPSQTGWATIFLMAMELIGHDWAEKMLQQHVVTQQVRHAYLFTGAAGIGRRTLALRFAQALNCLKPPSDGSPCGVCRHCTQLERMQHPDLTILQAEEDASTIKVDQVRDLQHALSLAPYEAAYRIALLLNFEQATDSAQNALLKTLEEPNPKVILLVTADMAENLLPTIVSRCEILHLRPAPLNELAKALVQREGLEEEQAYLLAHISGGRPGYALRLLREPELLERRRQWLEDLLHLLPASRRERFAYVEVKLPKGSERSEDREILREAFSHWLSFWRDVLLVTTRARVDPANPDYADSIRRTAAAVTLQQARTIVQRLENGISRLNNANLRVLADALLLDWPRFS
jgi:DNA polymerase-3 subunit delta'